MEKISNWGKVKVCNATIFESEYLQDIKDFVSNNPKLIARGKGRSYGDSSLQNSIFSTLKLNKIIDFNPIEETIECESGVLIDEILTEIVPKGFFLHVVPGTKRITIGGAVASNVHGKNHHKDGSFGDYILSFKLLNENNDLLNCSLDENKEIFSETIGGMGLTGILISVKFKLKKIETSYILAKSLCVRNLNEMLYKFNEYQGSSYIVGWIDGFSKGENRGRGVLSIGEHATIVELKKNNFENKKNTNNVFDIPNYFPSFFLNDLTVFCLNKLIYIKNKIFKKEQIKHYDSFFFPLDKIGHWNNLYGKNGFSQYQFVIPFENSMNGINSIFKKIEEYGNKSYLTVIKNFGDAKAGGNLSFPMEGITVAMDFKFKVNLSLLFHELDLLVVKYGGRVYLTKDAHLTKEMFLKMYPDFSLKSKKIISKQFERYL